MNILYVKALHIIFIVTWFAGLFYIVRLFIYHTEAEKKAEPEKSILQNQFKIMEKRLWYGITWPSLIGTFIFGFWLLWAYQIFTVPWIWLKLFFVFALFLYHLQCGQLFSKLRNNQKTWNSFQLRLWNEGATILLVSIIFIVVLKDSFDKFWGFTGLVLFAILLVVSILIYRKRSGE
ncbi:MAG: protoporphyrinogen IX oxidase [Bacteroidetes bacterium RIFCSPLOWO2_02_FULL_36_8]|nr:MAG: protoporphyrinogen IX oxidase [Bacteroidetes bacterium RIFCSPLOWO2_02_FULL_36_8]OFY70795.1 MAG: protoporphyrinogen IX oxidase [Bacteroidetes bacterium RIFCSPLOWO2_12_FULL_37_12]